MFRGGPADERSKEVKNAELVAKRHLMAQTSPGQPGIAQGEEPRCESVTTNLLGVGVQTRAKAH